MTKGPLGPIVGLAPRHAVAPTGSKPRRIFDKKEDKVSDLHKSFVTAAAAKGLVRFEAAKVTVKNVPNKGDEQEIPFEAAVFTIETPEQAAELFKLAEADRPTVKTDDGEAPGDNPVATLLGYAYGLNCRAKVRSQFEAKFEDPDKAVKKIAEMLVKSGQFKSFDKALAAAKLMREDDE